MAEVIKVQTYSPPGAFDRRHTLETNSVRFATESTMYSSLLDCANWINSFGGT